MEDEEIAQHTRRAKELLQQSKKLIEKSQAIIDESQTLKELARVVKAKRQKSHHGQS
jgi:hypothetical protein